MRAPHLALASVLVTAAPAFAERRTAAVRGEVGGPDTARGDGVYGRFDGDLELGLGFGAELDFGAEPRLAARSSLHYFTMAGAYVSYADAPGSRPAEHTERKLGIGVDLRPLFVPRWALDQERGPAFVDLSLDSLSLGMGVFWAQPGGGSFGDQRGFEMSLGLGFPLAGRAGGPWLEARGALRWPDDGEREESLLLVVSWRTFVISPLSHN
jgi:hypothetical protein